MSDHALPVSDAYLLPPPSDTHNNAALAGQQMDRMKTLMTDYYGVDGPSSSSSPSHHPSSPRTDLCFCVGGYQ